MSLSYNNMQQSSTGGIFSNQVETSLQGDLNRVNLFTKTKWEQIPTVLLCSDGFYFSIQFRENCKYVGIILPV